MQFFPAPERHLDRRNNDGIEDALNPDKSSAAAACLQEDGKSEYSNIMIKRENSKTPLPKAIAQLPEELSVNEDNAWSVWVSEYFEPFFQKRFFEIKFLL